MVVSPARLIVCAAIMITLLSPSLSSAATCEPPIAKAMAVEGKVDVRTTESTQWRPVKLYDTFCPGDVIRVQERSRADIALSNQPMLRLDQNTTMTLGGIKKEGGSLIELTKGAMHFFSRLPRNLDIRTAFVNAGVEGTEGVVRVGDDKAEVTIFEGKVVAANESGTVNITDGQSVVAEKGKAPVYRTLVKPRDAVQWALHYPAIQDVTPEATVKEDDPRSLAARASRSLSVGRVDEAKKDLDQALKIDPKNSEALALQSVIAVVQNDKDRALTLAQQAVAADPNSPAAKTALSYAQQARFDLEGARTTLEEEVKAHPDNALAWARLAELRSSFSDLDGSLEAAEKAVAINPNISRTQTVLGFAHLLRIEIDEAKAAFGKAIELDQSDAMARLGLGLAKFREGNVEEGRREMEVAASLDPNNSMIRSYLGKAYFEEKKDALTEREYKNAKELDPKDPTPFFYDALQKQLTNRPVEALKDMEQAIELNQNRAVYRGNLQMDSDVAARSSSIARIYENLGFQYQALVEGWNSVNIDPTSFTAHRFLADSYATLRRHEIARTSELLISQLLQPLNVTPIQPTLAESNLFLLASLGPTATSFNEFNTLMVNRDRATFQGSLLGGELNTFGAEGIIAGIHKNISYSVGYNNFTTDGWRTNALQKNNIGTGFIQVEVSPRTSVQAEYRYRSDRRGDTRLMFFPEDFFGNLQQRQITNTYRLGLKHEIAADSILLGSFIYRNAQNSLNVGDLSTVASSGAAPGFTGLSALSAQRPEDALTGEIQHQYRSRYLNLVTGGSLANVQSNLQTNRELDPTVFGLPPGTIFLPNANIAPTITDLDHTQGVAYGYSYLKPLRSVILTLGLSGQFRSGEQPEQNGKALVNPKFGLLWTPLDGTLIRLAAFQTLKRTLVTNQTLEPTQVAGFNQFYDDPNGTSAWRYGAALNQKVTKTLFVGAEGSIRDMKVPFATVGTGGTAFLQPVDWHEYQARGYVFWAPHDWVALRAEYLWEKQSRSDVFNDGATKVDTTRIPLGVGLFHPSGFSFYFNSTFWTQIGNFTGINDDRPRSGSDNFWLFDAFLTYRLPKRYGLLTVGAANLTDKKFNFHDTDPNNALIQPTRMVFAKLTLALP
jgi:tetratricopeptide (TPR) repeat protein